METLLRDESLANTCIEHCADRFDECNASCSNQFNSTCTYECNLDYFDCQNLCPCFPGCPDGCYQCQTSFCQCQDKANSPDFITCKVIFIFERPRDEKSELYALVKTSSKLILVSNGILQSMRVKSFYL